MILLDIIIKDTNKLNVDNLKHLLKKTGTKNVKELLEYLKDVDIIEFVEIDESIDFELTDKQKEVLKNMVENKRSIVLLGKGSGKNVLTAILMRYCVFKDLLKNKLDMNRIDYVNLATNSQVARTTFFRELTLQLKNSKMFNIVNGLYKIRKNDISIFNDHIVIHSLNSVASSVEGKNVKVAIIDEISDENFKDALNCWWQVNSSAFTRFKDAKCVSITWCRFRSSNPLNDVGYYLYDYYKKDKETYRIMASHKEVRGQNPYDYDPNNIIHKKQYDLEFTIDEDTTIDINNFNFTTKNGMLELKQYYDEEYVRFKIKKLVRPCNYVFCHIDTSVKRDKTVISLFYNNTIEYHVIEPRHNKKINYVDLEDLVKQLKKVCKIISFDQYQSEFLIQKYNCKKWNFSSKEQYEVINYFNSKFDEFKFVINKIHHNRFIEEFSAIYIDHNKNKMVYEGKESSDIVDSIIYAIYNSKDYESKIKKSNKTMSFGFNVNLF